MKSCRVETGSEAAAARSSQKTKLKTRRRHGEVAAGRRGRFRDEGRTERCTEDMSKAGRVTRNASDFTVPELRERLKSLGQSSGGTKAELIGKLMALDLEGVWMEASLGANANDDEETGDLGGGGSSGIGA